uniref:Uncharacterized protein n=1 Tax=Arundo donax TaxID=35708 RepID=A0A0A8ZDK4_ARUDO
MASPVALLISTNAGAPSLSFTLVLRLMSLYQCWLSSRGFAGARTTALSRTVTQ